MLVALASYLSLQLESIFVLGSQDPLFELHMRGCALPCHRHYKIGSETACDELEEVILRENTSANDAPSTQNDTAL